MAVLSDIKTLLEQGRFLSALECSKELGPLEAWPDARGQVLATRLASHLGSPTISRLLIRRAKRRWPDDPAAHYYYWAERCNSRRFVRRWRELQDLAIPGKPDRSLRSHRLAFKATILAAMLEHADRYAEALIAYQESSRATMPNAERY